MKTRTPYDRDDIKIGKNDCVLEVGPGHFPSHRANVLVEKFIDCNFHRSDDSKMYSHQDLIIASGEDMPFSDKEFDYVICCQVLEHSDNPEAFIKEHTRVARRGYMETPSFVGEMLFPKESHKWVILEIDGKIVMYEKTKIPTNFMPFFGNLFLDYLPYKSLAMRILMLTHGDIWTVRHEWKDDIEYIINPEDNYYKSFFTKPWTADMIKQIFPPQTTSEKILSVVKACMYILKSKIKQKLTQKQGMKLKRVSPELNNI